MIDPASPSNANALLRAQGLRPRKRWGQNFLCDRNVLDRIARAAALEPGDHTLEIGAGLGGLTRSLADLSVSVTTVEIDRLLEPILQETLEDKQNVRIVFEDFLKLDLATLLDEAFGDRPGVVVANIPYYITTPILERLIEHKHRIKRVVLLVQLEFAQRMVAEPGTEEYGAMSVYVQYHTSVELVGKVPRHVFLPAPEVSSAIVTLDPVTPGSVSVKDEALFFRLVRAAFGQRRKTVANALSSKETSMTRESVERVLNAAGIDPGRRGETLALAEFARVADVAVDSA
jgi:16S rRNA (adenine1518-N6/adenine1519-N6)-dimethyltransferase